MFLVQFVRQRGTNVQFMNMVEASYDSHRPIRPDLFLLNSVEFYRNLKSNGL